MPADDDAQAATVASWSQVKAARVSRRRFFDPAQEAAIAALSLEHPAATYEELIAFAHQQFARRVDRQTMATTLKRQGVAKARRAKRSAPSEAAPRKKEPNHHARASAGP